MWTTAVGAYGDTLAAVGNAKHEMSVRGLNRCSILHYGFDRHISEFLAFQPCFDQVVHVRPKDRIEYSGMLRRCSDPALDPVQWLPEMLAGTGICARDVVPTHTLQIYHPAPVHLWHDPVLPKAAEVWAKAIIEALGAEPFYLLHPRSEQSTPAADHWPHWDRAIDWLLEETPHTYVVTGSGYHFKRVHARIKNLIGLTPTMMEVYALAGLSQGIISTPNSLSLWSVITGKRGLIAYNRPMVIRNFFHGWIECQPNVITEFHEPLNAWIKRAEAFLNARQPAALRETPVRSVATMVSM